ncbi:MAG: hypothetical protein V3V16_04060 [Melioribacteraceae bacterium]
MFLLFLNSCGININEKQDCIPKVSYESTKSVKMFLVEVTNPKFSYSDLKINKDERFLCLSVPNMQDCRDGIDDYGALKFTELPLGTKMNLTGTVKIIEPYGFSSAFKSEMTYLQGTVNDLIVWIQLFRLSSFAMYESESTTNFNSNKTLGINDSTYVVMAFDCFD